MIGLKEKVIVRLEIDIEVIKGELGILEQNAIEHPLEKLITMWGDQITQTRMMVLFRKLEKHGTQKNDSRRKRTGV